MTEDKDLKGRWYRQPNLVAMPQLVEIRNQLRRENLHDTEEVPLEKRSDTAELDPALREVMIRSLAADALVERIELPELVGRKTPGVVNRIGMSDLFYSFGRSHPGAITLHNFPKHLQNLRRDNGEHLDLAAVDIFRDRERGATVSLLTIIASRCIQNLD